MSSIAIIEKQISPFIGKATSLNIRSEKDLLVASEDLSRLNRFNDALKEDREKITAPLNEALKEVRLKYKPLENSLAISIALTKEKILAYQTGQLKKEKQALVNLERGEIDLENAVLSVPKNKFNTSSGNITFKTMQKLKITNSAIIPRQYLIPDEDLILEALKNGEKVKGCEIEEVAGLINRRK